MAGGGMMIDWPAIVATLATGLCLLWGLGFGLFALAWFLSALFGALDDISRIAEGD